MTNRPFAIHQPELSGGCQRVLPNVARRGALRAIRVHVIALTSLFVVSLAACSRSASQPPEEALSTQVALTLTAAATLFDFEAPPAATEPAPAPEAVDTAAPSETPVVAPSPTAGGTMLAPNDPRQGLNLEQPEETDDFSVPGAWLLANDPNTATTYMAEGRLIAIDHFADNAVRWYGSIFRGADVFAEISAQMPACAGKDAFGIALRLGGEAELTLDRGYTVEFSCDGSFRLRKFLSQAEDPVILLDWTGSAAIQTGAGATNRVGFLARGTRLYALANGQVLGSVEDNSSSEGFVTLFASADQTRDLTVYFDDFALWRFAP